jgi:hypothetical protein
MKHLLAISFFLLFVSCRSRTEKWLDGMADFKSRTAKSLSLQLLKNKQARRDTTALTYQVRIYPAKDWVENRSASQQTGLFYGMDSCFSLRCRQRSYMPVMVQPLNNGIAGSFEYLVSFDLGPALKWQQLQLVYRDRFIDGKEYVFDLNKP